MTVYLSPVNGPFVDANGNPLSGGKINTYQAGTSTPLATFTSNTGLTQQANPIILNTLGLPASPIWLTASTNYKFVVTNSADAAHQTIDNISGINDVSAASSEWNESGFVPTYISATSFSVPGDQTALLQVNRRIRTRNTSGYVYSRISASVYGSVTTVTVVNDSTTLDSGLSLVAYSFLSPTPNSVPYAVYAGAGANVDITSMAGGNSLLINSATTSKPTVRQTVLNGPVDSSGFAAFVGSTGSATVTATGTLIATAANGYTLGGGFDYTGSITNPSWTGLSTNGTMYLYLDIAAAGTCTTGSTTLVPVYQWGGTYSTTNNQFTFNTQEMTGKVGNGSTAVQTYRVFVGEVTVSGGVVTAIVWYALQGRYDSGFTATLPSAGTAISRNSYIGAADQVAKLVMECTTTDGSYAVGDRMYSTIGYYSAGGLAEFGPWTTRNTVGFTTPASSPFVFSNKASGNSLVVTLANWKYKLISQRAW